MEDQETEFAFGVAIAQYHCKLAQRTSAIEAAYICPRLTNQLLPPVLGLDRNEERDRSILAAASRVPLPW